jgi:hypothetical protein
MVTHFSEEPLKEGITDDEWTWKRNMKIGTWNVRSLFWPRALKVLHNELSALDCDVVVLQETRLENDIKNFDNLTLFSSGLESKKLAFVCSLYVSGEFLKYVKRFQNYK